MRLYYQILLKSLPLKLLVGSTPGSESDASVICFVSGYIGCSISYRRKSPVCKELLVEV